MITLANNLGILSLSIKSKITNGKTNQSKSTAITAPMSDMPFV